MNYKYINSYKEITSFYPGSDFAFDTKNMGQDELDEFYIESFTHILKLIEPYFQQNEELIDIQFKNSFLWFKVKNKNYSINKKDFFQNLSKTARKILYTQEGEDILISCANLKLITAIDPIYFKFSFTDNNKISWIGPN